MATSEIEKLERRYAENPQGLTFAPLAEVHRKNGAVARALELLQAGLELHPNYIPASIVLGRCHQDLGDLSAAEAAFAHVLRLDDENVIALKSLAEINEKQERFDEAEGLLSRLVTVDRSNDEAREQLSRIATAKDDASKPAPAPAPEELAFIPGTEPAASVEEPAQSAALEPAQSAALEPASVERAAADLAPADNTAATAYEPEVDQRGTKPAVEPVAGLVTGEFQPPAEELGGIESSEEVVLQGSAASEFRVPDASEDFLAPAAAPASRLEPEFVVTETMAEVLLQQGYPADALRIYRELARRGNGDQPLRRRIEELEAAVARLAARRPSYLARDTNGQSVAVFFRAMLAARPPAAPGDGATHASLPADGGAPSRPAQDALSLSSIFSEDSLPVPPAVPVGEERAESGVSFDAFFSPPAEGPTPAKNRSSDPGTDDLDQFHSWLQNLKR